MFSSAGSLATLIAEVFSPLGSCATLIAVVSVYPRRELCYTDSGSECLAPQGAVLH